MAVGGRAPSFMRSEFGRHTLTRRPNFRKSSPGFTVEHRDLRPQTARAPESRATGSAAVCAASNGPTQNDPHTRAARFRATPRHASASGSVLPSSGLSTALIMPGSRVRVPPLLSWKVCEPTGLRTFSISGFIEEFRGFGNPRSRGPEPVLPRSRRVASPEGRR